MTFFSLDAAVRNMLLKRRYPLHFYIDFLVYGKDCLRELSLDSLKIVNTKIIPVDATDNSAQIPNDYTDYVEVGIPTGQTIRPLVEDNNITPLQHFDSNFNITRYDAVSTDTQGSPLYYGYLMPMVWNTVTFNDYGENIGRLFGWGAGQQTDTFTIVNERNVIQLKEVISTKNIVLKYISDGMDADAASQIPTYAYQSIQDYMVWQMKENNRNYSDTERERAKNEYNKSVRILRARLSDITIEKIKRIAQQKYYAATTY